MKTILVPLGDSEKAINTLQYAIDFAAFIQAKIYVIQVFETTKVAGALKNMDELLEKDRKEELEHVLEQVDTKGIEIIAKPIKGHVIDSVNRIATQLKVDLIIASAKNSAADSSIYVGKITGGMVKQTELPLLIIPKVYKFKPFKNILLAVRSGVIRHSKVLDPLDDLVKIFKAKVNLLHVITPHNTNEDNSLHKDFETIADTIVKSENATVYQGVLEHLIEVNPDMICVIRRKRGFFNKLWEKNHIKKVDFESRVPLLVLKGNL
jgi:nucleotide-binding universal stress UspA family protein